MTLLLFGSFHAVIFTGDGPGATHRSGGEREARRRSGARARTRDPYTREEAGMAEETRPWHLAKYEVLLFSFEGVTAARDAVLELKQDHELEKGHVLAEALVSHQASGKIHVHDPGAAGVG